MLSTTIFKLKLSIGFFFNSYGALCYIFSPMILRGDAIPPDMVSLQGRLWPAVSQVPQVSPVKVAQADYSQTVAARLLGTTEFILGMNQSALLLLEGPVMILSVALSSSQSGSNGAHYWYLLSHQIITHQFDEHLRKKTQNSPLYMGYSRCSIITDLIACLMTVLPSTSSHFSLQELKGRCNCVLEETYILSP